jgi:tripartite-type tricarboxylate transporter receptor subunit TctC
LDEPRAEPRQDREPGAPGKDANVGRWQGFFVPARTARHIVDLIQRATARALRAADVRARLKVLSYEPVGSIPVEFEAYFKSELARSAIVVRQANIPPQD